MQMYVKYFRCANKNCVYKVIYGVFSICCVGQLLLLIYVKGICWRVV